MEEFAVLQDNNRKKLDGFQNFLTQRDGKSHAQTGCGGWEKGLEAMGRIRFTGEGVQITCVGKRRIKEINARYFDK